MLASRVHAYGLDLHQKEPVLVRCAGSREESVSLKETRVVLARQIERGRAYLAAAVPATECALMRLRVPLASPEKARRILPSQLDVQLPFPVEQAAYVFPAITRTSDGQVEALAVAMRAEDLQSRVHRVAGLCADPTQVDHEALALLEQADREFPDAKTGLRAVLWIANDHVTCVLARGVDLLGCPAIRMTAESDAASAVSRLGPLLRATLAGEFMQAFPWILAGAPFVSSSTLRKEIQAALIRPAGSAFHVSPEPGLFLARALARRALRAARYPCNLRQGALAHPGLLRRDRAAIVRDQWISLAAGLILLAGSQVWLHQLNARAAARQYLEPPQLTERLQTIAQAVAAANPAATIAGLSLNTSAFGETITVELRGVDQNPFVARLPGATFRVGERRAGDPALKVYVDYPPVASP